MAPDHYFSENPGSDDKRQTIAVRLAGRDVELTTAAGTFSPQRLDPGTKVLLDAVPSPPPRGSLLDLGCGWGPIALSAALQSPELTVWAVDINSRSLDLTALNAKALNLTSINAVTADDVPEHLRFDMVWSNPPIRVGKAALHGLLETWLPRLADGGEAWLVVAKKLGADSLQKWLDEELPPDFITSRESNSKGYRVLKVKRG
ncbi:methyltransferase [Saxibacter everestensis]|uniref:Methyltransferase n=1 Tax=Saxibacter everestensis TaxID=2909229 RepID=A0ABY8QXL9_9MICO|nr:methyltransferase [Brevibacteriaceae bacterium ZFBP1038]